METKYHPNGAIKSIMYLVNGRVHRCDGPDRFAEQNGPAYLQWDIAGVLRVEEWYQNGSMHRDNGPAYRQWNAAGVLIKEEWYQHDRAHRGTGLTHFALQNDPSRFVLQNGPAYQEWNDAGELIREEWWQNNRKLTPQEIERILRPVDIMMALRENLPQPIFEEIADVFRAV